MGPTGQRTTLLDLPLAARSLTEYTQPSVAARDMLAELMPVRERILGPSSRPLSAPGMNLAAGPERRRAIGATRQRRQPGAQATTPGCVRSPREFCN